MENYEVALLIFAVLLLVFSAHVIINKRDFDRDWRDAKCTPAINGAHVYGDKPCCKAKTVDIDGTEIKDNEFVQVQMGLKKYCYNDRDVCVYDCKTYNPLGAVCDKDNNCKTCDEICSNVPAYSQGP
jgi:hypothetical protein